MSIKKLFFQTAIILTAITLFVVAINSFQVHLNATKDLKYLQKQYLNATYEIYKNEMIGDVLVGNNKIISSLLKEVTTTRGVGSILTYNKKIFSNGEYQSQSPKLTYKLNLGNEKYAKLELYPLIKLKAFNYIDTLLLPLLLELFVLSAGFLLLLRRMKHKLLNPLNGLVSSLNKEYIENFSPKEETVVELKQLCSALQKMKIEVRKKAQYETESIAAKQVAHDIRSPLACLNLLLASATTLPEKQRILMRSSIQRITDIANILHTKAKQLTNTQSETTRENTMISSLLELLVTEKRIQLGRQTNIHIDLNLNNAYGLFSSVNASEFKRMLSNLIDNSLESFDDKQHSVSINVEHENNNIIIHVKDDGKGIPEHILDKVGTYGFTYGKQDLKSSGNGLGVYHALKTVNSLGGNLVVNSNVDSGTLVSITIPRSKSPEWFVSEIQLSRIKQVVILDDDESIHSLWRDKLDRLRNQYGFKIIKFLSVMKFERFLEHKLISSCDETLFLIDYEFVGQNTNGLEVIENFTLNTNAILVTSHHDEINIQEKAAKLCVGIIPKGVVSYVPLL